MERSAVRSRLKCRLDIHSQYEGEYYLTDWGTFIDRQIRKAMEDGEFSNLPGEGKPLQLDDNPNTPNDMRMAYKILRDNDLAPEWIMHGKAIEAKTEQLMDRLHRAAAVYRSNMDSPASTPVSRAHAEGAWRSAQFRLVELAAKLNNEINSYNLKIPAGVPHKSLLNIQREISRLVEGS